MRSQRLASVRRFGLLTALACVSLVALFSCGDYSWDDSFIWGSASGTSGNGAAATGWIGGGSDGWKQSDGAPSISNELGYNYCNGIFVTENGHIYVADMNNHRICKWSSDGMFQGWLGNGSSGWQTGSFSANPGSDVFSFNYPTDVWVNGVFIYVADRSNHRISRWSLNGQPLGWIGGNMSGWQLTGTALTGDWGYDAFDSPSGIFVMSDGTMFVADTYNNRISQWTPDGYPNGWIGGGSSGWQFTDGASSSGLHDFFTDPEDVFIDQTYSYIYVADTGNNRISRWDHNTTTAAGWIGFQSTGGWSTNSGTGFSSDPGAFDGPRSVFVDGNFNIFVADSYNHRVSKFDQTGVHVGWLGAGSNGWQTVSGTGPSPNYQSFNAPAGIHVSSGGNIYVADEQNNRITRWSQGGPLQTTWDTTPPAPINDLSGFETDGDVLLSFTAVGDDDVQGTARAYIVKYAFSAISDLTWGAAIPVPQYGMPQGPGSTDGIVIPGLAPGMTYFFAVRVVDDATNVSGISNSPSVTLP